MKKTGHHAHVSRSMRKLVGLIACASAPARLRASAALAALVVVTCAAAVGVRADGALDPTFGTNGKAVTNFGVQEEEFARAVAIQPDGKIVVAGYVLTGGNRNFLLARFHSNGTLDTSFGVGGKVVTDFFGSHDEAHAVAVQSDGKIVAAGSAMQTFPESEFALARYQSNGTLDTSFGLNGKLTTDFTNDGDTAYALTIQSDGTIVAAGQVIDNSNGGRNFGVAVYFPNGDPNPNFSSDGKTITDIQGGLDDATSVTTQPDGKIIVAGSATVGSATDFAVVRYTPSGIPDTSFDGDGKVITNFFGSNDAANAVAVQADGRIVVAGEATISGVGRDFALARYTNTGALDATFDGDGKATANFSNTDYAVALAFQPDGKILAAGLSQTSSTGDDFTLVRFTSGGIIDTSFGVNGRITTDFFGRLDFAQAATLQPDGKLVLAGTPGSTTGSDFGLARYVPMTPAPGGTWVQFSQQTFSGFESANDATTLAPDPYVVITVERTGNLNVDSKVEYRTIDDPAAVPCNPNALDQNGMPFPQGAAYARCDYATTIDTLIFAIGETQKSFSIPLINDIHVEQQETFAVVLGSPEGAALGERYSAAVNISSDDAGGGTNPSQTHPFFVRQHYLDFLSREPEDSGFDAWLGVLTRCQNPFTGPETPSGCDRILVSYNFFISDEFQLKGLYAYKFYKVALGRLPDYNEISRDMRSVTGQTAAEVFAKRAAFADAFAQRFSFRVRYDALSNAQYVAALLAPYGNPASIHTRNPDDPENPNKVTITQAELVNRLDIATLTRAKVLRAVVESDAVHAAEYNGAFVAMQYFGYLRRTPDQGGYNAWLGVINANPNEWRTMINGFLNSTEYTLRFGP